VDHPTRWVLLPFIQEERSRRILHLPHFPQMKIYNMYETIMAGYLKFQKQTNKKSNFFLTFSKQSFHLLPSEDENVGGWRGISM